MTRRRIWLIRWVVLPLSTFAVIVAGIWSLETGRFPSFGGSTPARSGSIAGTAGGEFFGVNGAGLGAAKGSGPEVGKPAPEFTLQDINGKVVHLSDFRGRPVLINFWATWCIPCRQEFPVLVKKYNDASGSLVILGVDIQENIDDVRKFVKEFQVTYPVVIDQNGDVVRAYRLVGVPSSFFVDASGILRDEYFGPLSAAKLEQKFQGLAAFTSPGR